MSQGTPTYVGLDVSKQSINVAIQRPDGTLDEDRVANTLEAIRGLVRRWADPGAIRACYEAGPTGYILYRWLTDLGIRCTVIAPSLTPRRPGERIKSAWNGRLLRQQDRGHPRAVEGATGSLKGADRVQRASCP